MTAPQNLRPAMQLLAEEPFLTVNEAAHVLRVSATTVQTLVGKEVLPRVHCMGRRIVIPARAVAELAGLPWPLRPHGGDAIEETIDA